MQWIIPALSAGAENPSGEASFLVLADSATPLEIVLRDEKAHVLPPLPVTFFGAPQEFGTEPDFARSVVAQQLQPNLRYDAELRVPGTSRAVDRCRFRTWPSELGSRESPFEIFLGSCYSVHTESNSGSNINPITRVISGATGMPHLKVLCGDQVYLDIPVLEKLPAGADELRTLLSDKYLANWDPQSSFGQLLRTGSNLLVTDDHEFWNNYPYFLSYGIHLWNQQFANQFAGVARELAQTFQLVPPTLRTLTVGQGASSLSLALLDGRYARSQDTETAHAAGALQEMATFLAAAPGPAVVVLSQPLFEPSARLLARTFTDRGLADMKDYGALVEALAGCPHDVLVLSGDIHGGRVASVERGALFANALPQTILEVVSSPLSLVKGGKFLDSFPDNVYPEKGKSTVPSYGKIERSFGPVRDNHGCRIRLWAADHGVKLAVEYILNKASAAGTTGPGQPYSLR